MAGEQATESIRSDLAISGELARAVLYNNPKDAATALAASGLSFIPTGALFPFAGATAPTGYLICDGSAVSRTQYAQLFATIGTAYGVGDGSTTFNIPDTRGRTIVGSGTGSGLTARTRGDTGGVETYRLQATESGVAAHTHDLSGTATVGAHTHQTDLNIQTSDNQIAASGTSFRVALPSGTTVTPRSNDYLNKTTNAQTNNGTGTVSGTALNTVGGSTIAAQAASAHQNMQPFSVAAYIIKT